MTVSETAAEGEIEVEPELLSGLESYVTLSGAPEEYFDVEAPYRGAVKSIDLSLYR